MAANSGSQMVVSGSNAGITPRQEVEAVLAVFRTEDGEGVTYEMYVEVYAAIRPHCQSADDCNECSLHVFQILDNEDLPRGVTRAMIVDCAIRAQGQMHTMETLIEELLESKAPGDKDSKRPKSALAAHIEGELDKPVDHDIVYHPDETEDELPPEDEDDAPGDEDGGDDGSDA